MKKEIVQVLSDEQAAALLAEYPVEQSFTRRLLPKLGLVSQDKFEGKGKNAQLVAEAGMWFTEHQTDEVDEDTGKKMWERTDLGTDIEAIIIFQRKQLRMYDESTQEFTSSPIYDSNEEMVPLYCKKVKLATDTPANLKALYPSLSRAGKPSSKLGEERVLYVLMGEDIYQLSLKGTSMYSFLDYARKTTVPAVVTAMGSEPKESGSTKWNQATFKVSRKLTPQEASLALEKVREIKEGIAAEKAYFAKDQLPTTPNIVTETAMQKAVREF